MTLIKATPLYTFLSYCEKSPLPKKVLDCGAGGAVPPLALFRAQGYETYGIEIDQGQIDRASEFCRAHDMELNIRKGDICHIPFPDASFSFLYSYHTSVHIQKADFAKAMAEFHRVLIPGGLCFVDFLSQECDSYGGGIETGPGQYLYAEDNKAVLYVHYTKDEIDGLISGFTPIHTEERSVTRYIRETCYRSGLYEYIMEKV